MYVLDGKASEYFAALNEREPNLPFYDIFSRMEDRFTAMESQENSQLVFHNRSQDQMNVSLVRQSQPCNFLELTVT